MQEPIAGRRIVSKGEYVLRRALQGGLAFTCTCTMLFSFMCGFAAVISLVGEVTIYFFDHVGSDQLDIISGLLMFEYRIPCSFGIASWLLWRITRLIVRQSEKNIVVPLTRANTADLPAPDSLVRASQEPAQAQEGVLLRAASAEAQAGQEEQLLRASVCGVYSDGHSQINSK